MKVSKEIYSTANEINSDNLRCWIEINLSNLEKNINIIKSLIPKDSEIICFLKDNCYGFSSIMIAKFLYSLGIKYFALSTLQEALKLRNNSNIKEDIIILNWIPITKKEILIQNRLIQILINYEHAKELNQFHNQLECLIKVDTGKNLLGFKINEIELIKKCYGFKNIKIRGIIAELYGNGYIEKEIDELKKQNKENIFSNICINKLT